MRPTVIFHALTVCGDSQGNAINVKDNSVTFKCRDNYSEGGTLYIYTFNAFGEIAERIKRMKIKTGSQVTIVSEMKPYIKRKEINGKECEIKMQSYNVTSIDFIKTSTKKKEEQQEETKVQQQEKIVQPSRNDVVDLDEFQRVFGS